MRTTPAALVLPPLFLLLQAPVSGPIGAALDDYLTRASAFGFSGCVLAAKDGTVVLQKGYGLADRAKGTPATADSVFDIGSITKQFTAAAILKLEGEGKLKVEDPISKHLPGVPKDKEAITLHHLLTHSSGLRSDFVPSDYTEVGREEYVAKALASELLFAPGSGYEYSNAGYSLLAAIIELTTKGSYEAYLRRALFEPAGLTQTGYRLPKWKDGALWHGYGPTGDWGVPNEKPWAPDGPYWALRGNGGILSTLADMHRWHQALQGDSALPAAARAKLFTPYVREGPGADSFYGYGWAISTTPRKTKLIAHNGGNEVFTADFLRFVDENAVLISASNARPTAIDLTPRLSAILFGRDVEKPPKAAAVEAGSLEKLQGIWKLASGATIEATPRAGVLELASRDAEGMQLLSGVGPKEAAAHAKLTEKTEAIVRAAAAGNFEPLRDALEGKPPLAEVAARDGEIWKKWQSELGEFRGVRPFVTQVRADGASVEAPCEFKGGTRRLRFVWEGDTIVDVGFGNRAQATRVVFTGADELSGWDPRHPKSLRIRIRRDAGGKPEALVIGEMAATR